MNFLFEARKSSSVRGLVGGLKASAELTIPALRDVVDVGEVLSDTFGYSTTGEDCIFGGTLSIESSVNSKIGGSAVAERDCELVTPLYKPAAGRT